MKQEIGRKQRNSTLITISRGPSQYIGQKTVVRDVNVELRSYCPEKFNEIIKLDDISYQEIMYSLQVDINRDNIFKAGEGTGKSGSFFFFSHDDRFLIKTLKGQEKQTMINMIDDFVQHIKTSNNKSLIARIYGMFTIHTESLNPIDFIIMQNTSNLLKKEN